MIEDSDAASATETSESDIEAPPGWQEDAISDLYDAVAWIHIPNLDPHQTEESLTEYFEQFGGVCASRILSAGNKRRRSLFALIGMQDFDEAKKAIADLKSSYRGVFLIQRGEAFRILRAAAAPPFGRGIDKVASSTATVRPSFHSRYPKIAFTIFAVLTTVSAVAFWIVRNVDADVDVASLLKVFNVSIVLGSFVIVGRRSGFASMRGLGRVCAILALFGAPAVTVGLQLAGQRPFWSVLITLLVWIWWGSKRAYSASKDNHALSAITAGLSIMLSIISIGMLPGVHYAESVVARWAVLPFALSVRTTLFVGWLAVLASTALNRALRGNRPRVRSLRAPQFPPASEGLPEDFRYTFVPSFDLANRMIRHCVFYLNLLWQPLARAIWYAVRTGVEAYYIVKSLLKDLPTIKAVARTTLSFLATVGLIYFCWIASDYQADYLRDEIRASWFDIDIAAVLLALVVFGLSVSALRLSDDHGLAYKKQMFAVAGAVYTISLTAAWLLWLFTFVDHASVPRFGPLIVFGTLVWWCAAGVVFATSGWRPGRPADSDAALSNFPKGAASASANP
jgi:hypothetical protein